MEDHFGDFFFEEDRFDLEVVEDVEGFTVDFCEVDFVFLVEGDHHGPFIGRQLQNSGLVLSELGAELELDLGFVDRKHRTNISIRILFVHFSFGVFVDVQALLLRTDYVVFIQREQFAAVFEGNVVSRFEAVVFPDVLPYFVGGYLA